MKHVLTNVRLSLSTLKSLKHRAVEEQRPAAALVREAVERYLVQKPAATRKTAPSKWLLGLSKIAGEQKGAPTDLAFNHDYYLYGGRKKTRRKLSGG